MKKQKLLPLCATLMMITGCNTTTNTSSSNTSTGTNTNYTYKEEITKKPTCTNEGLKTFICNEDTSKNYTEIIPALGHDLSDYTRNKDGSKMVSNCKRENCDYKEENDIVKVIVLAGQSNAVGHSYASHLTLEQQEKFNLGFDNIKINYNLSPYSDSANKKSDGFVPVKLGQGRKPNDTTLLSFGPEIGIADYLSKNYPNEKFYIIKTATGGTTLHNNWYSPSSNKEMKDDNLFNFLLKFTDESMDLIKENNEYPEIISYCWMQGENDAKDYYDEYENNWKCHVNDLKANWESKNYITPNGLSIIDAGITNYWGNYNVINQIKEDYAAKSNKNHFIDVESSSWVSTYKDNTDYAHLDANAMLNLGEEFGKNIDLVIKDLNNKEIIYEKPKYEENRWNGIDYSTSLTGEGTETNPYLINSPSDMAFFAKDVKEGNDYLNKFVKLNCDLNMSNPNFTGIGGGDLVTNEDNTTKYVLNEFKGTFDGDNHNVEVRIYKMYVSGLFNASSGTIKNVSTSGTIFARNRVAGGIVGYLNGGKVENVINNANIAGRFYENGKGHIGGVVGFLNEGEVINSINNGSIFGSVTNFGDKQGVGGVIGTLEEGVTSLENLTNNGYVYNRGYNTGGVIGLLRRGKNFTTSKLYNHGIVIGKTNTGGVIGVLNYSNTTIDDVHNYGDIKGTNYVGGVIGALGYDGNRTSTLSNSINNGKVEATLEDSKGGYRCGGIAGMAYGSTVNKCINNGEVVVKYKENEEEKIIVPSDQYDDSLKTKYVGYIVGYKTGQGKVEECTNNFGK